MLWKIDLSDKISKTQGKETYVPSSETTQSSRARFSDRGVFLKCFFKVVTPVLGKLPLFP